MKAKALNQIDTNLEQIIIKLTAAGQRNANIPEGTFGKAGTLPPEEWDSLKLAQDTLSLLRTSRKTKKVV